MNDGSTDGSDVILKELSKEDSRVKIFYQENAGPSAERNKGLSKANGLYIQFVDADDYIEPNMTEKLVNTIVKHTVDLVICSYNVIRVSDYGSVIDAKVNEEKLYNKQTFFEDFFKLMDSGQITSVFNKLYKKDLIDKNGMQFNEEWFIGEDGAFNLDYIKKAERVYSVEDALYNYVIETNSNSLMASYKKDYAKGLMERTDNYINFIKDEEITFDENTIYRNIPKSIHAIFLNLFSKGNMFSMDERLGIISATFKWDTAIKYLDLNIAQGVNKNSLVMKMARHQLVYGTYFYYQTYCFILGKYLKLRSFKHGK